MNDMDAVPRGPIRVFLVEDKEVLQRSIALLISETPDFELVGVAATGEEALENIPPLKPHVVVMDIMLPGISGVECVRRLKDRMESTEFLMLTIIEDHDQVFEALQAGATGYLVKRLSGDRLPDSIRELVAGGSPMSCSFARRIFQQMLRLPPQMLPATLLSIREEEVLRLLASGKSYKQIAEIVGLSVHTVRTHLHRIYKKLQVQSKTEAVDKYRRSR